VLELSLNVIMLGERPEIPPKNVRHPTNIAGKSLTPWPDVTGGTVTSHRQSDAD
jgi:hypothetical protein